MGIVTLQDVRELPVEGIMELPIPKLMTRKLVTTYLDETLDDVFIKLRKHGIGHLPVVSRENPKELIGIVTRSDIIKAYDKKRLAPSS